jgi:hypothetical protein
MPSPFEDNPMGKTWAIFIENSRLRILCQPGGSHQGCVADACGPGEVPGAQLSSTGKDMSKARVCPASSAIELTGPVAQQPGELHPGLVCRVMVSIVNESWLLDSRGCVAGMMSFSFFDINALKACPCRDLTTMS